MLEEARGVNALTVAEYVRRSKKTDLLTPKDLDMAMLGLFSEVGSLLSVLKKKHRDSDAFFGYQPAVTEEFGDVLWYFSAVARRARIDSSSVFRDALGARESAAPLRFVELKVSNGTEIRSPKKFERSLMKLAAEAGDLIKRFNNGDFEGNKKALHGDLVKLARPLIESADAAGISLATVASKNLEKIEEWRPPIRRFPELADKAWHPDEQLPRKLRVKIYERKVGNTTFVFQKCGNLFVGDRLTDNRRKRDDYRFHDVFHFAYAAVLGWSPVTRALLRVKRKSAPEIDEGEDGARAILIEEGLTAWLFEKAKDHGLFKNTERLSLDLLKSVKDFVKGYEPETLPIWMWEKAILDGYKIFRLMRQYRKGVVILDLNRRSIGFQRMR